MRKNKMMRTAAVLGVATMLTASVISGTFAKYTTSSTGSDNARVAKWGITMGNNGKSTFSNTYEGANSKNTVAGIENADVVAPGTHGGATYIVTGKPETAYKITFKASDLEDVFLKKDLKFTYTSTNDASNKNAEYATGQSGTVSEDYYPVNYSVKIESTAEEANKPSLAAASEDNSTYLKLGQESTFETMKEAMAALENTVATYETPNTEANLKVEFKWAWAFDSSDVSSDNVISVTSGHAANDAYDTVLGDLTTDTKNSNLAVEAIDADNTDVTKLYSTKIAYKLSMTATQID